MVISNKKLAEFANVPMGTIVTDEEGKAIIAAFNAKRAEEDEERYRNALATANRFAYIVTDTWTHGGISLRRGEVVFFKHGCDGDGMVMVTRSKAKTAQGLIWTCTPEEAHAHAAKAASL